MEVMKPSSAPAACSAALKLAMSALIASCPVYVSLPTRTGHIAAPGAVGVDQLIGPRQAPGVAREDGVLAAPHAWPPGATKNGAPGRKDQDAYRSYVCAR